MLKVLQVAPTELSGGSETVAWNLHCAYRRGGHSSWLAVGHKRTEDPYVLPIRERASEGGWARMWRSFGEAIHPLNEKVNGLKWLGNKLLTLAEPQHFLDWSQGVEDFNFPATWHLLDLPPKTPDILHYHNLIGHYFDLRARGRGAVPPSNVLPRGAPQLGLWGNPCIHASPSW